MAQYESEGIVVRKYNLSDADRIALVLTRKYGLIRGVATGAKRLKSRFSGSLEFFSKVDISFYRKENKDLANISDSELKQSVLKSLTDADVFMTFGEIADLLIKMTPPYEHNERLYEMTVHCVESIVSEPSASMSVRVYFEIWLLKLGGFLPDWSRCSSCGITFESDSQTVLDIDFQLSCESCKSGARVGRSMREAFILSHSKSAPAFARHVSEDKNLLEDLRLVISAISDAVLERAPINGFSTLEHEKDAA